MHKSYQEVSKRIAKYLANKQTNRGSFPARSFYGETFAIFLWSCFGRDFSRNIEKAMSYYEGKDKSDPQFHWEFNNYALCHYYNNTGDTRAFTLLKNSRFRGTKVTNWILLRAVTRLYRRRVFDNIKASLEINNSLSRQKEGFFFDEDYARSFQYHCFSTALIGELFELTDNKKYKYKFLSGVDFISNFIMPNGDTLYIGRGQEQILGYGALIFILEFAHKITGNKLYKKNAGKVFSYLLKFQRTDGSFPLVLREGEIGYPNKIDTEDTRFLGWYAYNNFFDYLPFLGAYLMRAHKVTISDGHSSDKLKADSRGSTVTNGSLEDYIIYSSEKYKAVVSKPGGHWTNDQPFPYVCYKNESIFPCYGGEQFKSSIYSIKHIPLPFGRTKEKEIYFREFKYTVKKNSLAVNSTYLNFTREFDFTEEGFKLTDRTTFKKEISFEEFYPINLYFFNLERVEENIFETEYNNAVAVVIPSTPCFIDSREFYCARGRLKALRENIMGISFGEGAVLERTVKVVFD